jgi:hypothetical protein
LAIRESSALCRNHVTTTVIEVREALSCDIEQEERRTLFGCAF